MSFFLSLVWAMCLIPAVMRTRDWSLSLSPNGASRQSSFFARLATTSQQQYECPLSISRMGALLFCLDCDEKMLVLPCQFADPVGLGRQAPWVRSSSHSHAWLPTATLSTTKTKTKSKSKNRDWWTYPFLPYVDLWLEAFHRLEGATLGSGQGRASRLGSGGGKSKERSGRGGKGAKGKSKRPRWSGVIGHIVYGLAPLVAVAALWRVSQSASFFLFFCAMLREYVVHDFIRVRKVRSRALR